MKSKSIDKISSLLRSNRNRSLHTVIIPWVACLTLILSPTLHSEPAFTATKSQKTMVGHTVPDFILSDLKGEQVALSDFKDKRAITFFFMGTGCPISNLYLTELKKMQTRYDDKGFQVIGIYSNAGFSREDLVKHGETYKIQMPVLHDPDQRVADLLRATRTAEVLLLDENRVVQYHGRVDDRFGYTHKRDKPRRRDLEEAIIETLADQRVSVPETEALGCVITRQRTVNEHANITYAKEISRIVERRCQECHRPGMIGPFSLLTYDDVKENADMIKEVVTLRRMPPWHADPRYGHFSNNRRMPTEEVDQLMAWIDNGLPFGDKSDLPPPQEYAEGWGIEKPDAIFELPEDVTVQADGVVPYLYFTVPTNFKEDVWIQAAEARPDNRSVVHHIIVYAKDPKVKARKGRGRVHITGTAPGDPPMILPPGVAKKIPAGAELIFQMHYTPTGKIEKDRSQVGFVFYKGKEPPKAIAHTRGAFNTRFEIPAGESNHPVESSFTFERDAQILSLMPHMHLRGKDFLYKATYPDGSTETLLSVPSYDFNWQNSYRFAKPLLAPKGTRIDCFAHFDNSEDNRANPDPNSPVKWGDQTWEEMMIGWMGFFWDESNTGTAIQVN